MTTLAQVRKCVYPYPVYEAHFADNTVARMSFYTQAGKPTDFERGRNLLARTYRKPVVGGYVEIDQPGKPWIRQADPMNAPVTKPKRVTAKEARQALTDLLDWLDGNGHDGALETARTLAA